MMKEIRTEYDLGMIFRKFGSKYENTHNLTSVQRKSFRAISVCRTSYLGGHIEKCLSCGHEHPVYNSCRNANCPKCQGIQRRKWLDKRLSEVLPVPYFHLIFTLPNILSELYFHNQSLIGGILFRTSADTILHLSRIYFNGTPHITSLIHTWGQTMSRHVHIHMLVTSGGLSKNQTEWRSHSDDYLFDVKEISREYKARFLLKLKRVILNKKVNFANNTEIIVKNINNIFTENWVVNSRKPFGGPEKVLEYLGRYTYRTAISNRRILDVSNNTVTFDYKDYRDLDKNNIPKHKTMSMNSFDFISRFLQHIPPKGFRRIRFYGIAGGPEKTIKIKLAILLFQKEQKHLCNSLEYSSHYTCPVCGNDSFLTIKRVSAERSPPFKFRNEREYINVHAA